jgi:hypothetical protein
MKIEKLLLERLYPTIICGDGEKFLMRGKNFRLKESAGKRSLQKTLAILLKNARWCIET